MIERGYLHGLLKRHHEEWVMGYQDILDDSDSEEKGMIRIMLSPERQEKAMAVLLSTLDWIFPWMGVW